MCMTDLGTFFLMCMHIISQESACVHATLHCTLEHARFDVVCLCASICAVAPKIYMCMQVFLLALYILNSTLVFFCAVRICSLLCESVLWYAKSMWALEFLFFFLDLRGYEIFIYLFELLWAHGRWLEWSTNKQRGKLRHMNSRLSVYYRGDCYKHIPFSGTNVNGLC